MPANINLAESGFTIADNITILGMNIKADLSNLLDCHNLAIEKIRKIIAFWQRFNLSLLGRIGITKNLLLPQINYLGCIITPDMAQFKTLSGMIEKFVVGRLNIAKNRLYLPINLSGLGIQLSLITYMRLEEVFFAVRNNIGTYTGTSCPLSDFFSSFKKGSKSVR